MVGWLVGWFSPCSMITYIQAYAFKTYYVSSENPSNQTHGPIRCPRRTYWHLCPPEVAWPIRFEYLFFIKLHQKWFNSIFSSKLNPEYSFKKLFIQSSQQYSIELFIRKIEEHYSQFQLNHETFKPVESLGQPKLGMLRGELQNSAQFSLGLDVPIFVYGVASVLVLAFVFVFFMSLSLSL